MDGFSRILEKKLSELLCTRLYVIFNPNQEKNLLGYKVVDNSNYFNSVKGGQEAAILYFV